MFRQNKNYVVFAFGSKKLLSVCGLIFSWWFCLDYVGIIWFFHRLRYWNEQVAIQACRCAWLETKGKWKFRENITENFLSFCLYLYGLLRLKFNFWTWRALPFHVSNLFWSGFFPFAKVFFFFSLREKFCVTVSLDLQHTLYSLYLNSFSRIKKRGLT